MFRHATMLALLLIAGLGLYADDKPRFAGPIQQGFLLPNGWTITPAGKQLTLTDLPLNIHPLRDGKHVLVAPQWASGISWSERAVTLEMTREQIEKAPDYDPAQLVDRAFEQRLFEHYGRPAYWPWA